MTADLPAPSALAMANKTFGRLRAERENNKAIKARQM